MPNLFTPVDQTVNNNNDNDSILTPASVVTTATRTISNLLSFLSVLQDLNEHEKCRDTNSIFFIA